MSEEMLVRHCSPTLAGIKTANMFSCAYSSRQEMIIAVRKWNKALKHKGLRVLPLNYSGSRALIYIYRPARLREDLKNETACKILNSCGYSFEKTQQCIITLIKRIASSNEFPHEIGLFLGYPPEDVFGFIENKAKCYKCVGCWKVYGDEEYARKTFAKYKKCTEIYCKQFAKGESVERLAVKSRNCA